MKICSKCNLQKSLDSFSKRTKSKDGLNYYCKSCQNEINKKVHLLWWANGGKEKKKIYAQNLSNEQKEKAQQYRKEWRSNGGNQKEKQSLISSPMRFSAHKIRNLIRISITKNGYSKQTKTCEILGAELSVVKNHLESKFQEGMTWRNHGEWHIDHIIPVSSAKDEKELISLNHYTNLQPLWAKDNLRKGDKLNYTLPNKYIPT